MPLQQAHDTAAALAEPMTTTVATAADIATVCSESRAIVLHTLVILGAGAAFVRLRTDAMPIKNWSLSFFNQRHTASPIKDEKLNWI